MGVGIKISFEMFLQRSRLIMSPLFNNLRCRRANLQSLDMLLVVALIDVVRIYCFLVSDLELYTCSKTFSSYQKVKVFFTTLFN